MTTGKASGWTLTDDCSNHAPIPGSEDEDGALCAFCDRDIVRIESPASEGLREMFGRLAIDFQVMAEARPDGEVGDEAELFIAGKKMALRGAAERILAALANGNTNAD